MTSEVKNSRQLNGSARRSWFLSGTLRTPRRARLICFLVLLISFCELRRGAILGRKAKIVTDLVNGDAVGNLIGEFAMTLLDDELHHMAAGQKAGREA